MAAVALVLVPPWLVLSRGNWPHPPQHCQRSLLPQAEVSFATRIRAVGVVCDTFWEMSHQGGVADVMPVWVWL